VSAPTPAPPTVWYFAYGSNLDPRTFLGRRRMKPIDTRIGVLRAYALCFDLPVGPGERGVANLRRASSATTWGVLYRITHDAFEWLDRTEGVPHGAYRRIAVEVECPDGSMLSAHTYLSDRRRPERKPSRRYLGLLLAGARHHALPEAYIAQLRGLELAVDEREEEQGELF